MNYLKFKTALYLLLWFMGHSIFVVMSNCFVFWILSFLFLFSFHLTAGKSVDMIAVQLLFDIIKVERVHNVHLN